MHNIKTVTHTSCEITAYIIDNQNITGNRYSHVTTLYQLTLWYNSKLFMIGCLHPIHNTYYLLPAKL